MSLVVVGAGAYVLSSSRSGVLPTSDLAASFVSFQQIARGTTSTVTKRVNYLITNESDLQELWKMTPVAGAPPTVNFVHQAVVAVFAGDGMNAEIAIAKIEDTNARMVAVSISTFDASCPKKSGQKPIAPYEIVVVPTTLLSFTHTDIVTTASCPK